MMKKFAIITILIALNLASLEKIFANDSIDFWIPEKGISSVQSGKIIKNQDVWKHRFRLLLGGSWYTGNIDSIIGTYAVKYRTRLPKRFEFEVDINGRYVEVKGIKNSNNHTARIKPEILLLNENLSITYIGMIQTQQFMDIYLRTTHELGVSYRFLRKIWWIDFSLSAAPQYEYAENWLRNIHKDFWRLSVISELKFWFSHNKKNSLSIFFSYSSDLKNSDDYKTKFVITLRLNISGILISENKFEWNYSSIPIENIVQKNDTSLTTSIGIEF